MPATITPSDKARAVAHYTALAAQAERIRRPDLGAITGWQHERRRALAMLKHQRELALRAGRDNEASALWWAADAVEDLLRDRAQSKIAESCAMALHDWDVA
jgi:hypothetical protein